MPLPPFTVSGDLPQGVYSVTLAEALKRYGRNRSALGYHAALVSQ
jgi:hypothetical protein